MKYIYLLLLGGLAASCGNKYEKLEPFSKLKGTWEFTMEGGKFVESWGQIKDSVMDGKSYAMFGKDTLFSEKLRIVLRNDEVFYIPAVSNQNKGKEIAFKLKSQKENVWIFANPKHDFPQEIKYEFRGKDSLIASVSGKEKGVYHSDPFPMKRIK